MKSPLNLWIDEQEYANDPTTICKIWKQLFFFFVSKAPFFTAALLSVPVRCWHEVRTNVSSLLFSRQRWNATFRRNYHSKRRKWTKCVYKSCLMFEIISLLLLKCICCLSPCSVTHSDISFFRSSVLASSWRASLLALVSVFLSLECRFSAARLVLAVLTPRLERALWN